MQPLSRGVWFKGIQRRRTQRLFPMTLSRTEQCRQALSVWLEDYRLVCRVDGANDDLFIITFLSIYLLNLPRPDWTICRVTSSTVGMTCGGVFAGNF
jgi:hypothetical protein